MAERKFVVTVKEHQGGQPWLVVEPHEDNGTPAGASIVMDLPKGASADEATRVARFLNDNLVAIRLARF